MNEPHPPCPGRYTVGELAVGPPLWRPDWRRCRYDEGHDGPHCDHMYHAWTDDDPESETE